MIRRAIENIFTCVIQQINSRRCVINFIILVDWLAERKIYNQKWNFHRGREEEEEEEDRGSPVYLLETQIRGRLTARFFFRDGK